MHFPNTADFYGAGVVAAIYCNLKRPPGKIRGFWQHGWIPQYRQYSPNSLAIGFDITSKNDEHYWVSRVDEEEYLRNHGFQKVKAIGLPIIYTPAEEIQRRPNSLLVMPAHSLHFTKHSWKFEEYADEIASIRKNFDQVTICVHHSCWNHGYWINSFRKRGLEVIEGANVKDPMALIKLQKLLSSYEYITTNTFGSHLAYAAYFGAKLSIYGPYAEYKVEDYSREKVYAQYPELLEKVIDAISEKTVKRHYPDFFTHPLNSQQNIDWGSYEVGESQKVSPFELRSLFGWQPHDRIIDTLKGVKDSRHMLVSSTLQHVRSRTPERIKHQSKMLLNEQYRISYKEMKRLRRLPPFTMTTTSLLGGRFRVFDPLMFLSEYDDLFLQERCSFVSFNDSPLIIEAYAGSGLGVLYFKKLFPSCRVITFEPDPQLAELHRENYSSFGFQDVNVIPFGVGAGDSCSGYLCKTSEAKQILPMKIYRLREFLQERVDFLKLNIEGAELEVLKDCAEQLNNVSRIYIPSYTLSDQSSLRHLIDTLDNSGFKISLCSCNFQHSPFENNTVAQGIVPHLEVFASRH